METRYIFCCNCACDIKAVLVKGEDIYPHRKDLATLPFWRCNECLNSVGCHHKTNTPTKPLGVIPSKEIKNARQHIHALLDPLWKSGVIKRGKLYAMLSKSLGYPYHTAEIRDIDEARRVYREIQKIKMKVNVEE